ncbi:MAG: ABC transporter substrate-binding protein, partial [Actinomycetota bacterium]
MARDPAAVLVGRQVFQPLVQFHPKTLALQPGLAESWKVLDGASRFTLKLRRGARFHNGRPVEAEDVVYSLNRLASSSTRSDLAFLLDAVAGYREYREETASSLAGISAPDASTVEIKLSAPWYDFLYALTHPATAPLPRDLDPAILKNSPVGSGPFRVAGPVVAGEDIVLERFDGFRPKPLVESVRLLIYEPGQQWKDFENGLTDIAEVPVGRLSAARGKYGSAGLSPGAAGVFLGFNTARVPDVAVRRAISNAIDRRAIATDVFGGVLTPANSLVPPGLPGHTPGACGRLCAFDPASGKSVFAGFRAQGGPALGLDYQEGRAQDKLAGTIRSQLAAAGLDLELRSSALPDFFKALQERRQDVFRLGWAADYPLAEWFLAPLLHSGSPDNYAGFSDPQVDGWIAQARSEADRVEKLRLYRLI